MKFNGLTDREVEESRKKHGSNAIPDSEPTTFWQEFKETFGDPMIKILLAIAALMIVMFFFGYAEIYEPLGTIVAVLIVAFVSAKTGVASDTKYRELKDSTKKDQCKVHRNGVVVVIDVDDVVVGDKVLLQAGDKIPADGILISGNLHVDNSALNGEAEECKKTEAPQDFQLADDITGETFVDQHSLFRGAVVFDGEGILDVRKVGLQTMMGKMAEEMQEEEPDSPLKVKLAKLAKQISTFGYIGAIVIAVLYFAYFIVSAGGPSLYFAAGAEQIIKDVVEAVSLAVVIIVCAVPEGLPLMISLVLMQNTSKMLDHNVLVRKAEGIETAGSLNILFSDKTGTITIGNRKATQFYPVSGIDEHSFVQACLLSSLSDDTPEGKSIVELGREKGVRVHDLNTSGSKMIKFTAETKCSGVDLANGTRIRKGAFDAIRKMSEAAGNKYPKEVADLVQKITSNGGTPLVVSQDDFIIGVIELQDIIKPGIQERFERLRKMGVKTVMVTGDNPLTAKYIAEKAGVDDYIAEAKPEDKMNYIRKEQENGKLVAMMGDGTNDAPALAQANVGVAMNSGTQAAKEAGNMVDLDNDPTKLIEIVEIGKQLLMTRGTLTTFSIANDVAKYFAIVPALFMVTIPALAPMNIMHLHSPESAILSAIIFNAIIIPILIPLALRGVAYKPIGASALLRRNLLIYGLGGVIAPFIGIKLIDMIVSLFM